jgi:hypothetical protein
MRLKFAIGGLIAAFLLSDQALSADANLQPPAPKSRSAGDVRQWRNEAIELQTFDGDASTPEAILLFDPNQLQPGRDGVSAPVRTELFEPTTVFGSQTRSYLDRWLFDCTGHRYRILSSRRFASSNLEGETTELPVSGRWVDSKAAGAGYTALTNEVCSVASLYRPGVDRAKAAPPAIAPDKIGPEETRAWMQRYIDAKGATLIFAENGVGTYFSPRDTTWSKDRRPVVWLHSELGVLLVKEDLGWRSMREQDELDCKGMRYRALHEEVFPGSNLLGAAYKVTPTGADADWVDAASRPNTDAKWLSAACALLPPAPR